MLQEDVEGTGRHCNRTGAARKAQSTQKEAFFYGKADSQNWRTYKRRATAAGHDALIRSVVRSASANDISVLGIRRGYSGLINGDIIEMGRAQR